MTVVYIRKQRATKIAKRIVAYKLTSWEVAELDRPGDIEHE